MFALEHSKAGYWSDFVIYAMAIAVMGCVICLLVPPSQGLATLGRVAVGLAAWSLVEYAMHRFVLHGLEPFKTWHGKHHDRPTALISAPTALSATLIAALVFTPAIGFSTSVQALALTLGMTTGYFLYAFCHHATHHWRARGTWLRERKRWHAIHHRQMGGGCYGVTSTIWDRVFRTGPVR